MGRCGAGGGEEQRGFRGLSWQQRQEGVGRGRLPAALKTAIAPSWHTPGQGSQRWLLRQIREEEVVTLCARPPGAEASRTTAVWRPQGQEPSPRVCCQEYNGVDSASRSGLFLQPSSCP